MAGYFTQYWTNRQWGLDQPVHQGAWPFPTGESDMPRSRDDDALAHTAGNLFTKAGVSVGDTIFIVTVTKGRLLLGGKIVVARICGQGEAVKALGCSPSDIYEAREHIIGAAPIDVFVPDRKVPRKIVEGLWFEGPDGPKTLVFKEPGKLDQQTLRGVRRLTKGSADLLAKLI